MAGETAAADTHLAIDNALRPYRWLPGRVPPYALDTVDRVPGRGWDATVWEPDGSFRLRRIADRIAQQINWEFDPEFAAAETLVHDTSIFFRAAHPDAENRVVQVYFDLWERSWTAYEHSIDPMQLPGSDAVRIGQLDWIRSADDIDFHMRPFAAYFVDGVKGMPLDVLLRELNRGPVSALPRGATTMIERPPVAIPDLSRGSLSEVAMEIRNAAVDVQLEAGFDGLLAQYRRLEREIRDFDRKRAAAPAAQPYDLAVQDLWSRESRTLLDRFVARITALPGSAQRLAHAGAKLNSVPDPTAIPTRVPIHHLTEHHVSETQLAADRSEWDNTAHWEPSDRWGLQDIRLRIGEEASLQFDPQWRAIKEIAYRTSVYLVPDDSTDRLVRVFYDIDDDTGAQGWTAQMFRTDAWTPADPDWHATSDEFRQQTLFSSLRDIDIGNPFDDAPQRPLDELLESLRDLSDHPYGWILPPDAVAELERLDADLPELTADLRAAGRPAAIVAARNAVAASLREMTSNATDSAELTPRQQTEVALGIEYRQRYLEKFSARVAALPESLPDAVAEQRPLFEVVATGFAQVDPDGSVQLHTHRLLDNTTHRPAPAAPHSEATVNGATTAALIEIATSAHADIEAAVANTPGEPPYEIPASLDRGHGLE